MREGGSGELDGDDIRSSCCDGSSSSAFRFREFDVLWDTGTVSCAKGLLGLVAHLSETGRGGRRRDGGEAPVWRGDCS